MLFHFVFVNIIIIKNPLKKTSFFHFKTIKKMEINYLPKKTTYELRSVSQKFPNEIDTPQNKFKEEVKRVFTSPAERWSTDN